MRIAKIASLLAVAGTVGLFGLSAPAARANINPTSETPTVTPLGGGQFQYDYLAEVDAAQTVQTGDFFTIYDFPGFVSASAPAGWAVSSALLGLTPATVIPNDSAAIPNVTFTRTGGNLVGPQSLGTFSIVSTVSGPLAEGTNNWAGRGTQSANGRKNANLTQVEVPTVVTPEPISMALLLPGLLPLGLAKMRRKNRS